MRDFEGITIKPSWNWEDNVHFWHRNVRIAYKLFAKTLSYLQFHILHLLDMSNVTNIHFVNFAQYFETYASAVKILVCDLRVK